MSNALTALSAAAPVAAGWSVHSVWMRRRIEAARRDPLTGLHTRDAFTRGAERLLRSGPVLVVLADVNDFKHTNDTHGHAAGDAVLAAVGERLVRFCRGGIAARLGGDEFAAVVPIPPAGVSLKVYALHVALCQDASFDGQVVPVSVSLGAASLVGPHRTHTTAVLAYALRCADEAMYTAKRSHGRTHLIHASDEASARFPSVNGRRAGRSGTHTRDGDQS